MFASDTFQVKNNGPAGAGGVTFTGTLPAALPVVSVNSTGPCTEMGATVLALWAGWGLARTLG